MIIGVPKRTLLALPRALRRTATNETNTAPRAEREIQPRAGLFASFAQMMERQADLMIRQMGE